MLRCHGPFYTSAVIKMLSESNQSVIRYFSDSTIEGICNAKYFSRNINA
jgi:hypothetical protein